MRWMVVTTARGQVVNELDVSEEQLVDVVSTWVRALPDADIYLDGQRVPQEARLRRERGVAFAGLQGVHGGGRAARVADPPAPSAGPRPSGQPRDADLGRDG